MIWTDIFGGIMIDLWKVSDGIEMNVNANLAFPRVHLKLS